MSHNEPHKLLTATEVAGVLNVSPRTLTRWATERRVPVAIRTDRIIRFELNAVLAALAPCDTEEGSRPEGEDSEKKSASDSTCDPKWEDEGRTRDLNPDKNK